MICFALFSHMLSLLTIAHSVPSALPTPTVSLEISIEAFPDSIVIPVCSATTEVNFIVRISDHCYDLTDLSGFNFDGNAHVVSTNFTETGVILYMRGTVFGDDDGDTWTAEITNPLGNVSQAIVSLEISQATQDEPPVITPPDFVNYTIDACEESVFGVLGIEITDDCTPVDASLLSFDDGGAGLYYFNPIVIQVDPYHAYVEYAGDLTPGVYILSATYQDVIETFTITVTQNQDVDSTAQIILLGASNWIIPRCETELDLTFAIVIISDCIDTIVSNRASFRFGDEEISPYLINGNYFEFWETVSLENDSTFLVGSYENESGIISSDSILISVVSYCNECPPVVECQGISDIYFTSPSTCAVDIMVPTPSILGNVDTVSLLTELITQITVELVDSNGEPTGEFITTDVVVASLDMLEEHVSDFDDVLGVFPDLPLGEYRLQYTLVDPSGDTILTTCSFLVDDQIEPVVVCNNHLNIVVNGSETVTLNASDVDEGSFDNCSAVALEIRRSHTVNPNNCEPGPVTFGAWSDHITFTDCDLGEVVTIELRVWDDRNGDGIPGNTVAIEYFDGSTTMVTDNNAICSIDELVYSLFHPTSLGETEGGLDQVDMAPTYQLLQNSPNPFSKSTLIGFHIAEDSRGTLNIRDLNGRLLFSHQENFNQGYHELLIDRRALKGEGVLFYTLETADFTATRKMVVLE